MSFCRLEDDGVGDGRLQSASAELRVDSCVKPGTGRLRLPVPHSEAVLMPILMLSADLMFGSRVSGAAARLGATLQTAATPEILLERLVTAEAGAVVVLDLTTRGFDPRQWVSQFRQAANPPKVILAYGPHVQEGPAGRRILKPAATKCSHAANSTRKWTRLSRGHKYRRIAASAHPSSPRENAYGST